MHSDEAKAWILSVVDNVCRSFIGSNSDILLLTIRQALLAQSIHMLPAGCRLEIAEEDANMQIVREIHEEITDVVRLQVDLDMPIRYLILHLNPHVVDTQFRIQIGPRQ